MRVLDLAALRPTATLRWSTPSMAGDISRVLVCVGHLCECQGDGVGARALLQELQENKALDAPVEDTVCLGMCGQGAMGCIEYVNGSETLVAGRDQMLAELNIDVTDTALPEHCPADPTKLANAAVSRILVCTGRMCQREKGGGSLLLDAIQQTTSLPCEASACLGSCGAGSLMKVEYADGCEAEIASTVTRLPRTLERLGLS
mmetsp:Transcript_1271/g.3573  ORF Transcript_1271/g.3573 Transcript_1271/m.3573 type:complete len:203 (+) Transcript_1271:12-620(+)